MNSTIVKLIAFRFSLLIVFAGILLNACDKEDLGDTEFPVIDMTSGTGSPQSCDTIYAGDFFTFKATFTDNVALSAYVVDVHHNFDHHKHKSSDVACVLSQVKNSFNPFIYAQLFQIPDSTVFFETSFLIQVPESIDTGDYHLLVRLYDKRGYQAINSVGIKILSKE